MVADWIAAGLDPDKSTLFVQSLVPEHAELFLLLSMTVPIPWLERVPTYKEQMDQLSEKDLSTLGFLGYPLLQTADVIIYDAQYVPVGEDQVPHLELSREIVRRFHNFYGELFVEPQPMLTKFPRLPGLDNRKMSKSYGNTINLSDDAEVVRKKVMQMYTDPNRVRADVPGTVEGNPVFVYHDAFNPDIAEVDDLKARYRAGKVGDVEVKTKLAKALNAYLEPMRARRADVLAKPSASTSSTKARARRDRRGHATRRGAETDGARVRERSGAKAPRATMGAGGSREWNINEFESILEAYPVRLQNFEGPLDLLLHLIKRNELDIYDIPITLITSAVPRIHRPDAGDESRRRRRVPRDGGDADSHQVAHAAAAARSGAGGSGRGSARSAGPPAARAPEVQGGRRTAARAGDPAQRAVDPAGRPDAEIAGEAPEPEIEVDLFSLITAFRPSWNARKQRPQCICRPEQIPIEDRIEQLMARLSETEACGFEDLFEDVQTRAGLVVTFLALLEMIRLKLIRVFQSGSRRADSRLQTCAAGRCAEAYCTIPSRCTHSMWRLPRPRRTECRRGRRDRSRRRAAARFVEARE